MSLWLKRWLYSTNALQYSNNAVTPSRKGQIFLSQFPRKHLCSRRQVGTSRSGHQIPLYRRPSGSDFHRDCGITGSWGVVMPDDEFTRKPSFKRHTWEQNNQHLKPTSLTESLYRENMNEKELMGINTVTVVRNRLLQDGPILARHALKTNCRSKLPSIMNWVESRTQPSIHIQSQRAPEFTTTNDGFSSSHLNLLNFGIYSGKSSCIDQTDH